MNQTINSRAKIGYAFKAKIRASQPHFMQKAVARQITIHDAIERHFRSSISVFIPKLTPTHTKPRVMLHVSNGGGSCLIRIKDSETLVTALQEIITTLQSDKWLETWWRISDIAENLHDNNQLYLNEELVDINEWHKSLENTVDVQLVQVEKTEGGEK